MDWINYTYCRMDADTEVLESENEFESDTDEDILNTTSKEIRKTDTFLNTTSKEIRKAAAELQVKDCMYNLKYLKIIHIVFYEGKR